MYEDLFEQLVSKNVLVERICSICKGKSWEQIALSLYQVLEGTKEAESFRRSIMKIQAKKNQLLASHNIRIIDFIKEINENLTTFAQKELELAGLFDKDSDYNGMLGEAVMELIQKFAEQGHSGMSAVLTRTIFDKLANYKPLTELTDNPEEWMLVVEEQSHSNKPLHQSRRSPSCFSEDGGKTYYDIDEDYFFYMDEDGTRWSGGLSKEQWNNRPMHSSKSHERNNNG